MKVAFDNFNAAKQFAGWGAEFELLRTLDRRRHDQKAESIASVQFAYGFSEPDFQRLMAKTLKGIMPAPRQLSHALSLGSESLRVAALVDRHC